MPVELVAKAGKYSLPVHAVSGRDAVPPAARAWAEAHRFKGDAGQVLTFPGSDGALAGALLGTEGDGVKAALAAAALSRKLPEGEWHFAAPPTAPELAALALLLGGYAFTRYGAKPSPMLRFALPEGADPDRTAALGAGVFLARDLVNTPTSDMGPEALEKEVRRLARARNADVTVITGDALLERNFPMIHAVGRAAAVAPRLIDVQWGPQDGPKVTLVGKGVCFDTGGLDIKPASGMLLMKKDMGGAANVIGLAAMLMALDAPIRLRVLIPAVENAISGNAFRPGDVLTARDGTTVEVGNTDAEGRLVLADALALADEESPEILIDMATLTGAARVALGPELPALFTDDDDFAAALSEAGNEVADPMWRLPLWAPYAARLGSKIADTGNVTTDGFAGAITAALFLKRFIRNAACWAHFDIFAWNPTDRPHCPVGGEGQAIRAIERVLRQRFG